MLGGGINGKHKSDSWHQRPPVRCTVSIRVHVITWHVCKGQATSSGMLKISASNKCKCAWERVPTIVKRFDQHILSGLQMHFSKLAAVWLRTLEDPLVYKKGQDS